MSRWLPSRPAFSALACASIAAAGLARTTPARADCTVRGTPVLPKTVQIFGSSKGTDVIGTFTGQAVAASVTFAGAARAGLKTTSGFRLEGYVELGAVPIFTARDVTVAEGHVWIGTGRAVKVLGGTDASVQLEFTAPMPVDQTVRANAVCEALALDPPATRPASPPEGARAWVTKRAPLVLRGKPGGDGVFRFTSDATKGALLFWGTEVRGGAVKVNLASDLVVDAWADTKDLEAMPRGEMVDSVATAGATVVKPPKVSLGGSVRLVKAPVEMPIRAKGDDNASPIGTLEAGTEVAVLETIVGWSNVVPTTFAVTPPPGGGFWVKAATLEPPVAPNPKLPSSPLK